MTERLTEDDWLPLQGVPMPGDWACRAACRHCADPDMFFPERGAGTALAKAMCRGCDVIEECLAYALRYRIRLGIWGGTSGRERRETRKRAAA